MGGSIASGRFPRRTYWLSVCLLASLAPTQRPASSDEAGFPRFQDIANRAGIDFRLDSGSEARLFLLEQPSAGILLIDYDDDGWLDIYIVNGSTPDRLDRGQKSRGNRLYRNDRNGTFTNVTMKAGVAGNGAWGMGGCIGDVDNNGFDDIFVTNYGTDVLYMNNGNGTFLDASKSAGVEGGNRWHAGCAFGDYDRDGDLDLYVSTYADFALEAARKDPRVQKALRAMRAPLLEPYRGAEGAGVDRNLDRTAGDAGLDQAAGGTGFDALGPIHYPAQPDELYENVGRGRFIDASERAGIRRVQPRYGFGVVWGDYDNDGDLDLFVANDMVPNYLFRNDGKAFTEVGLAAGVAFDMNGKAPSGMGADMADYDNDGNLDITVTNFSGEYNSLYRGTGKDLFIDAAAEAGLVESTLPFLGWGTQFVDLDLDGFQDLVAVNGHVYPRADNIPRLKRIGAGYRQRVLLFRSRHGGTFEEIGATLGRPFADVHGGRGLAVGDLNNDGQMDLVIANQEERPSVWMNRGVPGGHWSLVKLRGTTSNRSAIGARVTLRAGGRSQMREVKSGGSYLSQSDLRVHFGLGAATQVDELRIRWPSGRVQVESRIPVNQITTIVEK
ncbi:MAG: CRTAC1 family protein [Acidobacteria bacterium]|nr:CRTAC1 family protein [Acidobacteriota bacterium]